MPKLPFIAYIPIQILMNVMLNWMPCHADTCVSTLREHMSVHAHQDMN